MRKGQCSKGVLHLQLGVYVCMCMHVCTCVHVCVRVYVHACMCVCWGGAGSRASEFQAEQLPAQP